MKIRVTFLRFEKMKVFVESLRIYFLRSDLKSFLNIIIFRVKGFE